MPPATPDFCYYEALEIEKTATQEEIISAYRRLARVHHPDKNPNDQNATARFQRIQAAHETLSNPSRRVRYDNLVSKPGSSSFGRPSHNNYYYDDSDDYDDEDDSDDDDEFFFGGGGGFGFSGGGGYYFYSRGDGGFPFRPPPSYEEMERRFKEAEEQERQFRARQEKEYQERLAAMLGEQRLKKEAEEKARLERERQKQLLEEMDRKAFEKQRTAERTAQDKRWGQLHPTTEAERQETCLHSSFWDKVKLAKKCKCGTCGQKRGMTAFKCPHCALMACQLCLNKFNQKRQRQGSTT